MTSFFEHQRFRFKRSYLKNLISLASADGHLDEEEIKHLYRIGKKRGLKEWQIKELLVDISEHELFLPQSFGNRMNLIYDFMEVIYADGQVEEGEVKYVNQIIEALKLPSRIVEELVMMFSEGSPSASTWSVYANAIAA